VRPQAHHPQLGIYLFKNTTLIMITSLIPIALYGCEVEAPWLERVYADKLVKVL
jgi:hypothetical protein